MNAPPVIGVMPPPETWPEPKVPPVISSPPVIPGTGAIPPPLPEAVLQREMIQGCLASAVARLEKERRKAKRYAHSRLLWSVLCLLALATFIATIGAIGTLGGTVEDRKAAAILPLAVCSPICVICFILGYYFYGQSNTASRAYQQNYKETLFTAAIRLLNPSFRYHPSGGISLERFLASGMFLQRIDRYGSEDRFQGVHGATAFEFAEVRAHYRVSPLLRGKDDPAYQPVFQGLYFIADFNKHFSTSALVSPRSEGPPGRVAGRHDQSKRSRIVHLEDPEFEREFVVLAEDEIEARYLLTPALMRRMLEIRRRQGQPVSFSFLNEKLHVALTGYRDLFEPDPDSSAGSIRQIQVFLNEARAVLSLIDMLNLNTRIWSKR